MIVRARFLPTALYAAGLLGAAAVCGFFARQEWGTPWLAGLLMTICGALALLGLILLRRALLRPVMLRVDEAGVYMRRINATIPWEAIAAVERTEAQDGATLVSLKPAPGEHAVFAKRAVMMTMALSERAGLPPLVVDLQGMSGTQDAFLAAARHIGRAPVIDQAPPSSGDVS